MLIVHKNQAEAYAECIENCKEHLRKYISGALGDEWLHDVTLADFGFFYNNCYLKYLNVLENGPEFKEIEEVYKTFVTGLRRGRG